MKQTPGQLRVAKAIEARKRIKHERMAAELRAAGYTVTPYLCVNCGTETEPGRPRCAPCAEAFMARLGISQQ